MYTEQPYLTLPNVLCLVSVTPNLRKVVTARGRPVGYWASRCHLTGRSQD